MISKDIFGKISNGEIAHLYTIDNKELLIKISTYGAAIVSIIVKDKHNILRDIVLGYDNVYYYEQQSSYIGCVVGRCCNRIKNAQFNLNGKKYTLSRNEKINHLHGGYHGFDKKLWQAKVLSDNALELSYTSSDGEEGYPGNLSISVIYTLKHNKLHIDYYAQSDKDTICNPTNHIYFNLRGCDSKNVLDQQIHIFSNKFTEDDSYFLPTGRILSVANTPLDLRSPQLIGKNINSDYSQIKNANGYNTNYIIKKHKNSNITHYATAYDSISGIKLKAYTDMPCFEFYSGNYLNGNSLGKNQTIIENYSGFCLEPQFAPNAINMPQFISPVLKRHKLFHSHSLYEIQVL